MKFISDILTKGSNNYFNITAENDTSGLYTHGVVGESVIIGDILYFDIPLNRWMKALSSDPEKMPARAVSLENKSSNSRCDLLLFGYIVTTEEGTPPESEEEYDIIGQMTNKTLEHTISGKWDDRKIYQRATASSMYSTNYYPFKAFNKDVSSYHQDWYEQGNCLNSETVFLKITIPSPRSIKSAKICRRGSYLAQTINQYKLKARIANTNTYVLLYDSYTRDGSDGILNIAPSLEWDATHSMILDFDYDFEYDEIWIYDIEGQTLGSIFFYDKNGEDILPAWTGQTPPNGYTYEYNAEHGHPQHMVYRSLQKFDTATSNTYCWHMDTPTNIKNTPFLDIQFSIMFKPHSYSIQQVNHNHPCFNKWRLYASPDNGVNWDLIHDVSDPQTWGNLVLKEFTLENITNEYNRYRLCRYSSITEGGTGHSIGEWKIYTKQTNSNAVSSNIYVSNIESGKVMYKEPREKDHIIQYIGQCLISNFIKYYYNFNPFTISVDVLLFIEDAYDIIGKMSSNTHSYNISGKWNNEKIHQRALSSGIYNSNYASFKAFNKDVSSYYQNWYVGNGSHFQETAYMWVKLPNPKIFKKIKIQQLANYSEDGILQFRVKGFSPDLDKFVLLYDSYTSDGSDGILEISPSIIWENSEAFKIFDLDNEYDLSFNEIWFYDISFTHMTGVWFYDENNEDILPIWTSSSAPSGYEYEIFPWYSSSGWQTWNVLNKITNAGSYSGWYAHNSQVEPFLEILFNIRFKPYSYSIQQINYNHPCFNKWRLYASPDNGVNWDLIHDVSEPQTWGNLVEKTFVLENITNEYNRYRLRRYATSEGGSNLSIGEWKIFTKQININPKAPSTEVIIEIYNMIGMMFSNILEHTIDGHFENLPIQQKTIASSIDGANLIDFAPFKSFDNNDNTLWSANGLGTYNSCTYFRLKIPIPKILKKLKITTISTYYNRSPRQFRVKAKPLGYSKFILLYDTYNNYENQGLNNTTSNLVWNQDSLEFELYNPTDLLFDEIYIYDISTSLISRIYIYDNNGKAIFPRFTTEELEEGYECEGYPYQNHINFKPWRILSDGHITNRSWQLPTRSKTYSEDKMPEYSPFIDIIFNALFKPYSYTLQQSDLNYPNFNKWRLYASPDNGVNWDLIHDVSDHQTWNYLEVKNFVLENITNIYNRYRLRRYSSLEGGEGHAIGQWNIFTKQSKSKFLEFKGVPLPEYQDEAYDIIGQMTNKTLSYTLPGKWNDQKIYQRATASSMYNTDYYPFKAFNKDVSSYHQDWYEQGNCLNSETVFLKITIPSPRSIKSAKICRRGSYLAQTINQYKLKARIANTNTYVLLYDSYTRDGSDGILNIAPSLEWDATHSMILDFDYDFEYDEIWIYDIEGQTLGSIFFYDKNGEDILPAWTGQTPPNGYTYEYNAEHGHPQHMVYRSLQKFDTATSNTYCWHMDTPTNIKDTPFIDIQFSIRFKPYSYSIQQINYNHPCFNKWRLYASPDNGVNWDLIHDVSDPQTWGNLVLKEFTLENITNEYNRYRLCRYSSITEGGTGHSIGEWKIYTKQIK